MKYSHVAYQTACAHPSRAPNWYLAESEEISSKKSRKTALKMFFLVILFPLKKYNGYGIYLCVAYQTVYLHPSSAPYW